MNYLWPLSFIVICACTSQSASPSSTVDTQKLFLSALRDTCEKGASLENIDKTKLCNCTIREYETRLKADPGLSSDASSAKVIQVATGIGAKCAIEASKAAN